MHRFNEVIGYAPPWDVLKPIIPPSTMGGGESGTASDHLGSGPSYVEWTGFEVALSTVGLKPIGTHGALTLDPQVTTQAQDSISGTINALPIGYDSYASMKYYFYVLSATSTVPTLLPDNIFHLDVAGNMNADGNAEAVFYWRGCCATTHRNRTGDCSSRRLCSSMAFVTSVET